MIKPKISQWVALGLVLIVVGISLIPNIPVEYCPNNSADNEIKVAADITGMDDILFTNISRDARITGYGLLNIEDFFEFQNNYYEPIDTIYIGLAPSFSDNLIYYRAFKLNDSESLLIERSSYVSNGYEMISIQLDSPLNPGETGTLKFVQSYKDVINFVDLGVTSEHRLYYEGNIFPILPYRAQDSIIARFYTATTPAPETPNNWRVVDSELNITTFDYNDYLTKTGSAITYLEPFAENMGTQKDTKLDYYELEKSKLEVSGLVRNILISPWGFIKVTENFKIENNGYKTITEIPIHIPKSAFSASLTDYLGEISETTISNGEIIVSLIAFGNRPALTAGSHIDLTLSYYIPFDQYTSINWLQESAKINLQLTKFDYLVKDQTINVIIDGCQSMDDYTKAPDKIQKSQGAIINSYYSDFVSPLESEVVLFTYTINVLDLSLRPIILMILIIILCTSFIILSKRIKKKKGKDIVELTGAERLPVREIQEFCSLSEEKNALILEIRTMSEYLQRKKIAKKKYNSVVQTNTKKIEEINKEIVPFKTVLLEASPVFENIIGKLDVFDAERVSIDDSMNLLDARYKQGKLPSRAAYQKLADGFLKRRRKIDRNYDKLIQQLRSYLL